MTKINHNSCWSKIKDDKNTITFKCQNNGNETATAFRLGNSWVVTGGRESPDNVTFAPTFTKTKKRAVEILKNKVERCPHTYINKHGNTITEYSD